MAEPIPVDPRPTVIITPAEKALLDVLLDTGATNPQIASKLGKSEDTIKSQMKLVMAKTGAATRLELAVLILRGKVRLVTRNYTLETVYE